MSVGGEGLRVGVAANFAAHILATLGGAAGFLCDGCFIVMPLGRYLGIGIAVAANGAGVGGIAQQGTGGGGDGTFQPMAGSDDHFNGTVATEFAGI